MLKKHYSDVPEETVKLAGSIGASIRVLINQKDGAPRFIMRRFEIKQGGHIGLHGHPEEHEIYIISGKTRVFNDKGFETIAEPGDVLYVPPDENHGYENVGEEPVIFLCIIPILAKKD